MLTRRPCVFFQFAHSRDCCKICTHAKGPPPPPRLISFTFCKGNRDGRFDERRVCVCFLSSILSPNSSANFARICVPTEIICSRFLEMLRKPVWCGMLLRQRLVNWEYVNPAASMPSSSSDTPRVCASPTVHNVEASETRRVLILETPLKTRRCWERFPIIAACRLIPSYWRLLLQHVTTADAFVLCTALYLNCRTLWIGLW